MRRYKPAKDTNAADGADKVVKLVNQGRGAGHMVES